MSIEELENKYLDKECVVLTCGPSLIEYSKYQIEQSFHHRSHWFYRFPSGRTLP